MSTFAAQLRHELTIRAAEYAQQHGIAFRRSYFDLGSIVFLPGAENLQHGNFHPASYRAILKRSIWRKRLKKVLTVAERFKDLEDDRLLCELDSCCSSDALLMNIFCHPRVRSSRHVRAMLGVDERAVPIFGWRARVSLFDSKYDRTEVDMKFGNLLVEAKLTETDFQTAPARMIERYRDLQEVFDPGGLMMSGDAVPGYQLIRGVLAAHATGGSFCVLCDARRPDLIENWYAVMRAVRSCVLRCRLQLLTWQELTAVLPRPLQKFLAAKYGIRPGTTPSR